MAIEFLSLADCRLAYQRQVGDKSKPGILFLGGYASDMTGTKAEFLAQRCAEKGINFIRFDYRGCGQSQSNNLENAFKFTDGTIGAWFQDVLNVFDGLTEGPQIIIGSSMGGWLGLMLAKTRPERIRAFIGVAAAPDFTEDLVWEKLTNHQREIILRDGEIYDGNAPPDHRVPMTLKLIEEARCHLLLRAPLSIVCPIRLLQGMKDSEVSWDYAIKIIDHIDQADTCLTLIKDGDHRLSMPQNLNMLWGAIEEFV